MKDFEQINGRLCVLTLHAKHQPIAIVNTYCPASTQSTETKEKHYQELSSLNQRFTSSHVTYVFGDFNARLETRLEHEEGILGRHVYGKGKEAYESQYAQVAENRLYSWNIAPRMTICL